MSLLPYKGQSGEDTVYTVRSFLRFTTACVSINLKEIPLYVNTCRWQFPRRKCIFSVVGVLLCMCVKETALPKVKVEYFFLWPIVLLIYLDSISVSF